ncbi:Hypothetical protein PP7435_CHR2-2001 [Komagataella phaffii CBS 7435]|uniref:Uncharacterized protein n=1 Tax=Komagataella phaffii (strain ATCC 76273 / CBS 7435 / CECT 11047 / NRRL Y-11430 / Wegner 21-1) TaxID=981350 RepID=A0A1G4KPT9_KOMPC|nr:Hypothetical protein BQ9382_C2-2858 [Komagataella phaffii CBS 7435]SCV12029.1 Hypothetical protein PP7435_CHR2-2001 [Komagataella phaffii CBS 7435]
MLSFCRSFYFHQLIGSNYFFKPIFSSRRRHLFHCRSVDTCNKKNQFKF